MYMCNAVARGSWIIPIHGSLHVLVDPVTRPRIKNLQMKGKIPSMGTAIHESSHGHTLKSEKSITFACNPCGMPING